MFQCVCRRGLFLILCIAAQSAIAACPENCNSCDNLDLCTSCNSGFWDLITRCTSICNENCLNEICGTEDGFCNACKTGLYGSKCQWNCNMCKEGLCGLRACTNGCKAGYYAYQDTNETFCLPCSSNCRSCSNTTECNVCNDGFYLNKFNAANGRVYVHCVQCQDATACIGHCVIQNCIQCQIQGDSELFCTRCNNGYRFNGEICIPNTNNCDQGCSTECGSNGMCPGNCNTGWTGESCSDKCASRCLKCDKNNSYYCNECIGDYYTTTCNVPCNPSCTKETGTQTCNQSDGYCNIDCKNKFWGQFCNQSCPVGCLESSRVCDRDYGTCTNGCVGGYNGGKCDIVVSKTSIAQSIATTTSESKTNTSVPDTTTMKIPDDGKTGASGQKDVIIIGAGAGGGVLVLLVIVVIITVWLREDSIDNSGIHRTIDNCNNCRRSLDKSSDMDEVVPNPVNQSENAVENPDAYLYAQPMKLNKEREKEEKQDYIYAQPNKPKTAKKRSKKEISEPHKLYDNVAVDLEDEQATTKETNVDVLELENLDEGNISFIETEVKIPTADTYYNTASLIRSRMQVPNLNEYIKLKTDYEKEFEKLPKGLTRTCNEALKPKNLAKNRYNGIYAYDATRVVLQSKNYVNSNYIDGNKNSPEYIASLGPTRAAMNKFEVFWETIWQDKIEKIVMLTNLEESGKMKCEQYWPRQRASEKYGDYKVACTAENVFSEFVVREFNIKQGSETRKVTQYHYTAWPDKTVPDTVASLVEFRDKVEQTQTTSPGPMMVHCSAGIGRTGTYIALDILTKDGQEEDSVDIFGCVAALRGQRAHMVQNLEQYTFLHHCVLYALTCDPQPLPVTAIQKVMSDDKISSQYQALMELHMPPSKDRGSVAINKSRKENRKGADIPGDAHRVRLTLNKHDYINAVYLNGYLKDDKFIIAQTPLPSTVEDFVSMLYQEKCPCVVCLDKEHMNEKTVGQYLPPANKVLTFGKFQVACKSNNSTDDLVIRNLKICRTGTPSNQDVTIRHYQFRGWSSSTSVPAGVQSFLNLVADIEKARKACKSDQPIAIHCLNGSERSSIFCVVSILLEKFALEGEVSLLNTVCHVRSRRQSAFQDIEHFRFCYACVKEMIKISDTTDNYNVLNG